MTTLKANPPLVPVQVAVAQEGTAQPPAEQRDVEQQAPVHSDSSYQNAAVWAARAEWERRANRLLTLCVVVSSGSGGVAGWLIAVSEPDDTLIYPWAALGCSAICLLLGCAWLLHGYLTAFRRYRAMKDGVQRQTRERDGLAKWLPVLALVFAVYSVLLAGWAVLGEARSVVSRDAAKAATLAPAIQEKKPEEEPDDPDEELPMEGPSLAELQNAAKSNIKNLPARVGIRPSLFAVAPKASDLVVHTLNVGAGSCHLIECPKSDDVIVYDCGQARSQRKQEHTLDAEQVKAYFAEVVKADRPTIVLSHSDTDHVSLIPVIMKNRSPESVYYGGLADTYRGEIAQWIRSVPENLVRSGWAPDISDKRIPWPEFRCGGAAVQMVTVNVIDGRSKPSTNPRSLVIAIKYGAHTLVLAGDAVGITEQSALRNSSQLLSNVTFVAASHHGARSASSNSSTWVRHLNPKIVLYSAGLEYGHPNTSVIARYWPSLQSAAPHWMWSYSKKGAEPEKYMSSRAEYVTELNGIVRLVSDGVTVRIDCSMDQCAGES